MVTVCSPLTLLLLLTLTLTPRLLASGHSNSSMEDPAYPSVSSQATGQPPGAATSGIVGATNGSEPLGNWTMATRARDMEGVTSKVTDKELTSMETSTDVVTITTTPRMTMKATSRMTSRMTPKTTSRMTSRMTLKTTSRATLSMASRMKPEQQVSVKMTGPSSQVGIIMFLFLLLLTLLILLVSAYRKLQGFGGQGSYYPCRLDRERYVKAEGGEGTEHGRPRSTGQTFLTAFRRLLPWRSSALLYNEEEEEEDEEGEEGEGEEGMEDDKVPGGGDGEAWPEGEAEGDSDQEDTDHSDSDDYSSLGGLDLRERAALEEKLENEEEEQADGSEGGQSEDNLPDPPFSGGDDLLSGIHSFSGNAQWSDTSHDITAL